MIVYVYITLCIHSPPCCLPPIAYSLLDLLLPNLPVRDMCRQSERGRGPTGTKALTEPAMVIRA